MFIQFVTACIILSISDFETTTAEKLVQVFIRNCY